MTSGYDFTDPSDVSQRIITYNADNMPVKIEHAEHGTTNYTYDGGGDRVKKDVDGSVTFYVSGLYEIKPTGSVKYVFAGNLRIAMIDGTGTYYFQKDHLGSTAAITKYEAEGAVHEQGAYLPFGGRRGDTSITESDYAFTDQERDGESGLYNYNARLYDPELGQFISPDSIVQNPLDPQTLNRYAYCRNNPLTYVDPSGHFWSQIFNVIASIAMGYGVDKGAEAIGIDANVSTYGEAGFTHDFGGGCILQKNTKNQFDSSYVAISAVTSNIENSVTNSTNGSSESERLSVCIEAIVKGLNIDSSKIRLGGTVVQKQGKLYPCDFQAEDPKNRFEEIIHFVTMTHEINHMKYDMATGFTKEVKYAELKGNLNRNQVEALRNRETLILLWYAKQKCNDSDCRFNISHYMLDISNDIREYDRANKMFRK